MPTEPSVELDEIARTVIGAAIEVHRHLGPGFLESPYEAAMAIELAHCDLYFERQVPMPLFYKGHPIAEPRLDFLVERSLVLELKAVDSIHAVHVAQVVSYLRAGHFQLGLLINFNVRTLRQGVRRVVCSS